MPTPQPTLASCCFWLTFLIPVSLAVCAEPHTDEPLTELAVLDPLVGSWGLVTQKMPDAFSARQECKWILNKQFLEIDTHVRIKGHPASSWRTLITYDKTGNCYRQWKFSDNGDVSTAHGAWNEKESTLTSTLTLSGRAQNGNDEESRLELLGDNTMQINVREFLDEKHTRLSAVVITLDRVPQSKVRQLTKP